MMTEKTYERISAPFRRSANGARGLEYTNKILTIVTYVAYIALVISQLILDRDVFWQVLLVPAIGFGGVTLFRKVFNASRPYEVLDIQPLLSRRKKGQSFPSRHAFSIFMIAMALGYVWIPLGIVFLVLGVLLAYIRVVGGVHFPRDVIAGALEAIIWGIVGFGLL
ncbi:MAG: phosphatase PAP2 family protein [Lachnospiraceae bacterium]